jgi:hypothetical protein
MPRSINPQHHPGASTTILSTADGSATSFSTAFSRPGSHVGRPLMHGVVTESAHESRAAGRRVIDVQESSFESLEGRHGLDIYATDAGEGTYEGNDTVMGRPLIQSPKARRRAQTVASGNNSMISSFFSSFLCCGTPNWQAALQADSPTQYHPTTRVFSDTHSSKIKRSGSAPPGGSPKAARDRQLSAGAGAGAGTGSGSRRGAQSNSIRQGSFRDSSSDDSDKSLPDGAQVKTEGSSTQQLSSLPAPPPWTAHRPIAIYLQVLLAVEI